MPTLAAPSSTNYGTVVGRTEPRLWTPPLRDLTPDTSYGYDVIEFARDVLGRPLDPWQQWLVIHAGELLESGAPRFRKVLVIVARQNGKTELLVILALYWMFVELVELTLGTSTNLDYARESWEKAVTLVESIEELSEEIPPNGIRRTNGEQTLKTIDRCRYKIAASNRKGGRSLTIKRLIMDELREHHDWSAWNAAIPAMNAVWDGQAWLITNQGDIESIVLNEIRDGALDYLETGQGDDRLGIFEWSGVKGMAPTDLDGLAQANPNLGRRLDIRDLMGDAIRAQEAGGKQLAGFLTEYMCIAVDLLDSAIDLRRWAACADEASSFPDVDKRSRVACFELSEDMEHATLAVATRTPDGKVYVRIRKAWTSSETARDEIMAELRAVDPYAVVWYPNGPAAAFASVLRPKNVDGTLMPGRIKSVELTGGRVTEACQGLADLTKARKIIHPADPLLDAHIKAAKKHPASDGWRFTRRDAGHVDAAYAAAGAVQVALTRPTRTHQMRVISR
jgi:hypothetical protein